MNSGQWVCTWAHHYSSYHNYSDRHLLPFQQSLENLTNTVGITWFSSIYQSLGCSRCYQCVLVRMLPCQGHVSYCAKISLGQRHIQSPQYSELRFSLNYINKILKQYSQVLPIYNRVLKRDFFQFSLSVLSHSGSQIMGAELEDNKSERQILCVTNSHSPLLIWLEA